jgi:sporulation protein YlmC with PRC-barrel domain
VPESLRSSGAAQARVQEFSGALIGFDVVDRTGERIGTVKNVNLGRTCIVVETDRSLFARKQRHAVHVCAAREVDVDTLTIVLATTKNDVVDAPEHRQLGGQSETAIARHYHDRLAALGEAVVADGSESR